MYQDYVQYYIMVNDNNNNNHHHHHHHDHHVDIHPFIIFMLFYIYNYYMYIIYIYVLCIYIHCIIQRYYTQFKFSLPLMTYQKGVGCQHSQLVVDSCADLITFRNLYLACHTPFCLDLSCDDPIFLGMSWISSSHMVGFWGSYLSYFTHTSMIFHVFLCISMHFLLTSLVSRKQKGTWCRCRRILVCPEGSNMEPRSRGWS